MPKLLFVHHSPSENTQLLRDSVVAALEDCETVRFIALDSLSASPEDVIDCDGLLLGTTENFGSIAGLTKDFFERIYYPCETQTEALPFAAYIRAGLDGQGSITAIDRITTGLRWRPIQPPILLHGAFRDEFSSDVATLAQTLALGLEAGIF